MKVTIKAHVHAKQDEEYDVEKMEFVSCVKYTIFPYSMTDVSPEYVCLGAQEFTVDIPDDFDVRQGIVANLEEEKRKATADYQKRLTELNAQIQSLLAIEA